MSIVATPVKIMATLFYNAVHCTQLQLLVLLLTSDFSFCNRSVLKKAEIPGHAAADTSRPERTIPQGTVRGINMDTHYNRTVFGFLGIPYAQPPVGHLRFRAPLPPRPWRGILDASTDTPPCPQFNSNDQIVGREDCLHLNLFTPQLPTRRDQKLLPVMVHVIGGGFRAENNSIAMYSPYLLLDKDVLFVVPNHRVGILGYLTTGDEVSPGNYGLKDLRRCLEWIQENIKYFGGDPERVTLFGASTGAMSIHLLALSESTDGLFHNYITESGSALSNTANRPRHLSVKRAKKLGEHLGCPSTRSERLVNCLRGVNVSQLLDTLSLFYVWSNFPGNVWAPTTEPDLEGALITETPANLYAAGKIRDLPWLATVNMNEGITQAIPFYEDRNLFEDFLDNIDLALPSMLDYDDTAHDVAAHTAGLKAYYLNDLTADRDLLLTNFTTLSGDALFVYSLYSAVRQQVHLAKSRQYFGCLGYRGLFSNSYLMSGTNDYPGAAHGDELIYLLGIRGVAAGPPNAEFNEADWKMADTMVQLWTSFATNGKPTMPKSSHRTIWKEYSYRNNYLQMGDGTDPIFEMKYDLFAERMQFWDDLGLV